MPCNCWYLLTPCCELLNDCIHLATPHWPDVLHEVILSSLTQSHNIVLVSSVRAHLRLGVTLSSPRYGQGPLGLADIRSATRLPPQPPGPPGVPLMVWGQ